MDNFDHPCKQTCSGWQQGYDKGLMQGEEERERLRKLQDMDAAIINGMRRVLATSRMAINGNVLPLELALKSFDMDKLRSHNERDNAELAASQAKCEALEARVAKLSSYDAGYQDGIAEGRKEHHAIVSRLEKQLEIAKKAMKDAENRCDNAMGPYSPDVSMDMNEALDEMEKVE